MTCKYCGMELKEGVLFCGHCGQRITGNISISESENAEEKIEKTKQDFSKYQKQREEQDVKWMMEHPSVNMMIGIIGCILMAISIWLPFISADKFGIKVSESLWYYYIHETKISQIVYFAIACIIICGFLVMFHKNFLALLFASFSSFPGVLLCIAAIIENQEGYVHYSFSGGVFVMVIGWTLIGVTWRFKHMMKKLEKKEKM